MNIISFLVNVPVLSDNKISIRPNSSGILLFLVIVPYISLSLLIQWLYINLAKSKLTFIDIGIIALNKIKALTR